jgi:hypothetical protein
LLAALAPGLLAARAADLLAVRAAGLLAVRAAGLLAVREEEEVFVVVLLPALRAPVLLPALRAVFAELELARDVERLADRAGVWLVAAIDVRSFSRSLITVRLVLAASRRSVLSAAATSLYAVFALLPRSSRIVVSALVASSSALSKRATACSTSRREIGPVPEEALVVRVLLRAGVFFAGGMWMVSLLYLAGAESLRTTQTGAFSSNCARLAYASDITRAPVSDVRNRPCITNARIAPQLNADSHQTSAVSSAPRLCVIAQLDGDSLARWRSRLQEVGIMGFDS